MWKEAIVTQIKAIAWKESKKPQKPQGSRLLGLDLNLVPPGYET
jgi:hypothetical protein